MSAPSIFCQESIYAKLMLLSCVVSFMENHREEFCDDAEFAISAMLSDIAKEVYPEWDQEERHEQDPV